MYIELESCPKIISIMFLYDWLGYHHELYCSLNATDIRKHQITKTISRNIENKHPPSIYFIIWTPIFL